MDPEKRPPHAQRTLPLRVGRRGKVLCREWFTNELMERWRQKEREACDVATAAFMGIHMKAKYDHKKDCYGILSAPMKQYIQRAAAVRASEFEAIQLARKETCRYLASVKEEKRMAVKSANLDGLMAQIESQKLLIAERDATIETLEAQNALLAQGGGGLSLANPGASCQQPDEEQSAATLKLALDLLEKNKELLEQRSETSSQHSSEAPSRDEAHSAESQVKDESGALVAVLEQNEKLRAKVEEHQATVKDRDTKLKEQSKVIKQMQTHLDQIIHSSRKLLTAQSTYRVRSPSSGSGPPPAGFVSPIFKNPGAIRGAAEPSSPDGVLRALEGALEGCVEGPDSPSRKTMKEHKEELKHVGQHVERQVNLAVTRKQAKETAAAAVGGEQSSYGGYLSSEIDKLCGTSPAVSPQPPRGL